MKWISTKDKLPENKDGYCLIYRPDSSELQGSKIQVVPASMVRIMIDASHWMSTPEPPPCPFDELRKATQACLDAGIAEVTLCSIVEEVLCRNTENEK